MYALSRLSRFYTKSAASINTMAAELADTKILKQCKQIIPELSSTKHKGQSGRVGIFGGSKDFTGAPYYSAISALRTGSDLIYVFCVTSAAQPIKSYSPELMVTPFFDTELSADSIQWIQNLHCAVIGPGLGKSPPTLKRISEIIPYLSERSIPLVFDADGVFFISQNPSIVKSYPDKVYLTPNINEFRILCNAVLGDNVTKNSNTKALGEMLTKQLGANVTILLKGQSDLIFNAGNLVFLNETEGSPRRCGGQGDILSGCLASFVVWAKQYKSKQGDDPSTWACVAASTLTRVCNRLAFNDHGRGMIASDMISKIDSTFKLLFDDL